MPPIGPPEDPGLDDLAGSSLDRWVADARVEAVVRQRSSERWLRQQAEEEATFLGVATDLVERGVPVALRTCAGRTHRGRLVRIGRDFVQIAVANAGDVLVALPAVVALEVADVGEATTGDRSVAPQVSLAEMVVGLAAERERALFVPLHGGEAVCGTVRSVGQDVVVVRRSEAGLGDRGVVYLPLASIGEVIPGV